MGLDKEEINSVIEGKEQEIKGGLSKKQCAGMSYDSIYITDHGVVNGAIAINNVNVKLAEGSDQ